MDYLVASGKTVMSDAAKKLRMRILETLELIASRERQKAYQRGAPYVCVSEELFNQWEDWYHPEVLGSAFNRPELDAIEEFNGVMEQVSACTPRQMPSLDEFQETAPWRSLSQAAGKALTIIRKIGPQ